MKDNPLAKSDKELKAIALKEYQRRWRQKYGKEYQRVYSRRPYVQEKIKQYRLEHSEEHKKYMRERRLKEKALREVLNHE